jgi:hypothetical protein
MNRIVYNFSLVEMKPCADNASPAPASASAAVDRPQPAQRAEEYPFWTWFLPNPLPPPKHRAEGLF